MIFYFSATGISKKLAYLIAERIDENVYNIEDELKKDVLEYTLADGERLGFVSPVYYGNVPDIFSDFIEKVKIHTADQYYCWLAMTYGSTPGFAPNKFATKLALHGLTTNVIFGLKGIDTFLPLFTIPDGDARSALDAKTALESSVIAEAVAEKCTISDIKTGPMPRLTTAFMAPFYVVMRKTSNFVVSDACTGCGRCAQNCPTHSIELDDSSRHPKWIKPKCMICMRCVHLCPTDAIDYGRMTQGKLRLKKV